MPFRQIEGKGGRKEKGEVVKIPPRSGGSVTKQRKISQFYNAFPMKKNEPIPISVFPNDKNDTTTSKEPNF